MEHGANVLIVEDEYIIAAEIQMILEGAGIHVIDISASGEKAIQIIEKKTPDLILMDIKLAGKQDGIQTAEMIQLRFQIPVIFLTSYSDKALMERAIKTEPYGYIIKPFNPQELQTTVAIALYKRSMEQKLHHYQEWLTIILSRIAESIVVMDMQGSIQFLNTSAEKVLGKEFQELDGCTFDDLAQLYEPHTLASIDLRRSMRLNISDSWLSMKKQAVLETKTGHRLDVEFGVAPYINPARKEGGLILVFNNISHRMKIERDYAVMTHEYEQTRKRLEMAEQNIQSIMTSVPIGTILLDVAHEQIVLMNPKGMEIVKNCGIAHDFRSIMDALVEPNRQELGLHHRFSITLDDNTYGFSLYLVNDHYLCIYIRDITEDLLLDSISESSHVMANMDIVFSSIRHEIGNPLSILKTTLMVLEENFHSFNDERRKVYFDRLKIAAGTIEDLLAQLKTYHLYRDLTLVEMDLVSFMVDISEQLQDRLSLSDIAFTIESSESPFFIMGCRLGLQKVMVNLINNAIDALEGRPDPYIIFSMTKVRNRASIKIRDNGCGIPVEDIPHVFTPLFTRKKNGTGLGLPIVRKIVTLMNGSILLKSDFGKGTEVTITLDLPARD